MPDPIEQTIKEIVAEVLELEPEQVQADGTLEQIAQIDSVAILEVVVSIERRFQIQIQEQDLQHITQLQQVIDLVRKKLADRIQ